jgi:hypothetical protein
MGDGELPELQVGITPARPSTSPRRIPVAASTREGDLERVACDAHEERTKVTR